MTKLSEYLRVRKIKQHEFAAKLCMSQSNVSRLVSGQIKPDLEQAFAIQRLTGGEVPVDSWVDPAALPAPEPTPTLSPDNEDAA